MNDAQSDINKDLNAIKNLLFQIAGSSAYCSLCDGHCRKTCRCGKDIYEIVFQAINKIIDLMVEPKGTLYEGLKEAAERRKSWPELNEWLQDAYFTIVIEQTGSYTQAAKILKVSRSLVSHKMLKKGKNRK